MVLGDGGAEEGGWEGRTGVADDGDSIAFVCERFDVVAHTRAAAYVAKDDDGGATGEWGMAGRGGVMAVGGDVDAEAEQ